MKSTTKELRKEVKRILTAQRGAFYGFNANNLRNRGYNGTDIQNVVNYFQFSKTQESFRIAIGME